MYANSPRRFGFTMIELIVVVTIIAALAGILIPSIGAFRRAMRNSAITTFGGAIQSGLTAYSQDYRDLPPSDITKANPPLAYAATWEGGEILAQALVGPLGDPDTDQRPDTTLPLTADDGLAGYGFRSPSGKKSGPYLELKNERNLRARWDKDGDGIQGQDEVWSTARPAQTNAYVFTMSYGAEAMPWLYYRAEPASIYTGEDFNDNDPDLALPLGQRSAAIWGMYGRFLEEHNDDLVGTGGDAIAHWKASTSGPDPEARTAFATQLRGSGFLLVHPGPDGEYGTSDDVYLAGN